MTLSSAFLYDEQPSPVNRRTHRGADLLFRKTCIIFHGSFQPRYFIVRGVLSSSFKDISFTFFPFPLLECAFSTALRDVRANPVNYVLCESRWNATRILPWYHRLVNIVHSGPVLDLNQLEVLFPYFQYY